MLKITETPHQGPQRVWTAESRENFCLKVLAQADIERKDIDHLASYDELVEWLSADLRELTVEEE